MATEAHGNTRKNSLIISVSSVDSVAFRHDLDLKQVSFGLIIMKFRGSGVNSPLQSGRTEADFRIDQAARGIELLSGV